MALTAINLKLNSTTTDILTGYDSSLINVGSLIKKYSGATNTSKFIGPAQIGIARPFEATTSLNVGIPSIVSGTTDVDWVFLGEIAAAAATRRVVLYEYNRSTSAFAWKGFITLTFPTATAHTIRGMKVVRNAYTAGTVSVVGSTVTGVGSTWSTDRQSAGSRIGFGSTNPASIGTWFEIASIGSDTTITLTSTASTISAGTSYVIDETSIVCANTNATLTNGGLFIAKGIRPELFTPAGSTISAATTVDSIRAVYWLSDSATTTNTIAAGVDIDTRTSWTDQRAYVVDVTGAKIYTYNIRKNLVLSGGKDTTSLAFVTGNQALTGTLSQVNNVTLATLGHGAGSGVKSLYFCTTTRVYRVAVSNIVSGSTVWQSDAMVEVPPGTTTTFAATATLSTLDYAPDIDRLVIATSNNRQYVTSYNTTSLPFDQIYLLDDRQLDQSTADIRVYNKPATLGLAAYIAYENGIVYMIRASNVVASNQIFTLPLGADKAYASTTKQYLMTPKFDVSNSLRLYNVYCGDIKSMGTAPFELPVEPYDIYYRTNGISDDSGSWTLIDRSGDLSSLSNTTEIQFAIAFQTIGGHSIPNRIMSVSLVYEDTTTDSHYEPSVGKSSIVSNIFAYRQRTAWGSAIPTLSLILTNATTGVSILTDTSLAPVYGTWEYSTDGSIWNAWSTGADAIGNYIRYTAASLPDSVKVRAVLIQA